MKHRFSHNIRTIHIVADLCLLNVSFLLAYFFKFYELSSLFVAPYSGLLFFINVAWFLSILVVKPYHIPRAASTIPHILAKHFTTIALHALLVAAFFVAFKVYFYSREHIFIAYLIMFFVVSFWKAAFTLFLRSYRSRGFNNRKVIIVGYGEIAEELKAFFLSHKEQGYKFLGFFDDAPAAQPVLRGAVHQVSRFVMDYQVDEIYCCTPYLDYATVSDIIDFGQKHDRRAKIVTDYRSFYGKAVTLERYDTIPVLNVSSAPAEDAKAVLVKRSFDVAFSLLVLFIGSPILALIALVTKLTSKGPIFYSQERVGKDGKPFTMFKFRSMHTDAEEVGPSLASKGDPRITPWGKFMRKTRLDELPQFYNVLVGDMSIVGPRPERQFYIDQIVAKAPRYKYLQVVKPGITSIGQIKFGYAENIDEMVKRLRYDIIYLRNVSLVLDLKIILLTVMVMLRAEGK